MMKWVEVMSRLFLVIAVASVVIGASVALAGKVIDSNPVRTDPVTIHTHVVKAGETLWDIAKHYSPRNADPRPVVYNIKIINKLDSAIIYPGQILSVPVWKE